MWLNESPPGGWHMRRSHSGVSALVFGDGRGWVTAGWRTGQRMVFGSTVGALMAVRHRGGVM